MERLPVNSEEQAKLLLWTRQAIERAVNSGAQMEIPDAELTPNLRSPHGAFVTIKKHGELRGCIGKMDFERALWANVIEAAVASALEDPRFAPVLSEELPEIRLEISVLEPPVELPDPAQFDPLRHGIIVEKGMRHALLLPKVAQEYGWDARKTLETVCWKAGLEADAWRAPDAQLKVFTAFDFGEAAGADAG